MNDDVSENDLKFIRLNNGDDIIAQVIEVGEDDNIDYMVIHPLKVVYIPSQRGVSHIQVAFMPWIFGKICEEQDFLIHAEDVITMGNVSEKMSGYYWSNITHFFGNEDPVEEIEQDTETETGIEEIIEAISKTRRIYH